MPALISLEKKRARENKYFLSMINDLGNGETDESVRSLLTINNELRWIIQVILDRQEKKKERMGG